MVSTSMAENHNPNSDNIGDDTWDCFESDESAQQNEHEGHKPAKETEIVCASINSAIETHEGSTSHESSAFPRSMVFFEKKDSMQVDSNEDLNLSNHLSILSNLIQHISISPANRSRYQYAQFCEQIGAKIIEERILRSLGKDLHRLIEARRLNFNTIRSCENGKARSCFRSVVYIHVMYDHTDPDYVGVYVGSSLHIGKRIKEHVENLTVANKFLKAGKKLERKKRRLNSLHINFWNGRPKIRDFWLVFGQLEMRGNDEKAKLAFLLNILEMFAMLILERCLLKSCGETCRKVLKYALIHGPA
jgi:hypothetical protein